MEGPFLLQTLLAAVPWRFNAPMIVSE